MDPWDGPKTLLVKFQMEKPKIFYKLYNQDHSSYDTKFSVSSFVLHTIKYFRNLL